MKDESKVLVPAGKHRDGKEKVFEYLKEHPTMSRHGLCHEFPGLSQGTLDCYKSEFKKKWYFEKQLVKHVNTLHDLLIDKVIDKNNLKLNKLERRALMYLEDWLDECRMRGMIQ